MQQMQEVSPKVERRWVFIFTHLYIGYKCIVYFQRVMLLTPFFIVHVFSLKVHLSPESNKLINQFLLQAVITQSLNCFLLLTLPFPLLYKIQIYD